MPSPLRIDITGAGGKPPSSALPLVDLADQDTSVAPGTDLTGSGLHALDQERSALPPDPIDALYGNEDSILLDPLQERLAGAHDRLSGALSDMEDQVGRGRGELEDMRSDLYQGNPWAAFTSAVMQPSWGGAMAALGKAAGAYGAAKSKLSGQKMDIDRLLANYDNASAQNVFKNRLGLEGFDISTMNAASRLAAIRAAMLGMRLKMKGLQAIQDATTQPGGSQGGDSGPVAAGGASGAPGGSGAAPGAPGGVPGGYGAPSRLLTLPQAFGIQAYTGAPALDYWAKANPKVKFQDTGSSLIPVDEYGHVVGKPISKTIDANTAANIALKREQFKANTGVDLGDPSATPALPGGGAAPAASASAASPSSPNPDQAAAAAAASGSSAATPGATQSQGFDSTEPNEADIANNVSKYIASQNLPPVVAQKQRATLLGGQQKNLDSVRQSIDTTNAVVQNIDSILSRVSGFKNIEAGPIGDVISKVPGTPQFDTKKQLESIKHNLMRDSIEALRALSQNGSLNMRITQPELENMQSRIANVSMGQSPKQFINSLQLIRDHFLQMQGRVRQQYERIYGPNSDATFGTKKFYTSESDAQAARNRGEIKPGEPIFVGGRRATWQEEQ